MDVGGEYIETTEGTEQATKPAAPFTKEDRENITLDGEQVNMFDYHACSLQILHGMEKIPFSRNSKSYQLEGLGRKEIGRRNAERMEKQVKKIVQIMLNVRSRGKATRAINNQFQLKEYDWEEQRKEKRKLSKWWDRMGLSTSQIIEMVLEKHEYLSSYFFTGVGLRVMNIESEITNYIYQKFIAEDKPILGFHDGYLVKQSDTGVLLKCMQEGFREVVGSRQNHRVIIKREI